MELCVSKTKYTSLYKNHQKFVSLYSLFTNMSKFKTSDGIYEGECVDLGVHARGPSYGPNGFSAKQCRIYTSNKTFIG